MNPVTPDLTNLVKLLPLVSRPAGQTLPGTAGVFSEGQLITATVQEVLDSVVWLKADGHILQARTELPLQPDQQVLLRVVEANPLRVHLQVQNSAPQNPTLDFKTLLTSWGLEADDINLAIANALLTHAHTVNPDEVEAVRTLWRTLPTLDPGLAAAAPNDTASLEALTYLHVAKLPLTGEALALARNWLNGLPPLTGRLAEVQQSLDNVLWQLYRFEAGQPGMAELHDTLLSARTRLANWPLSPDQPSEKVIANLATLTRQLGTPAEAKIAALPLVASSSPAAELFPATLAADIESGALALPVTKAELFTQMGALERLTAAVTTALEQGNLDAPATQALHRLAHHLDLLANDLNAGHIANLTHTLNPAVEPAYTFPLLLATPDGPRQAQLKIYPQPGQPHLDPQNVRLAILLDLPSLGEIAIDLTIFERQLTGKILSGQPQTHQLVAGELGQLAAGLSSLGYRVEALTSGLLASPAPKNEPIKLSGVDVSA